MATDQSDDPRLSKTPASDYSAATNFFIWNDLRKALATLGEVNRGSYKPETASSKLLSWQAVHVFRGQGIFFF